MICQFLMVFGPFRDTFFFDVSETCLTGYFCVTCCADHFPQLFVFIALTWGRFWPILVFVIFFARLLYVFSVFLVYVAPHSYQQMLGLW